MRERERARECASERERVIEGEGAREKERGSFASCREARKRETRSVLKNKKLPYIFQALTCAWVGWVGRRTERGVVESVRREGPLRGEEGRGGD